VTSARRAEDVEQVVMHRRALALAAISPGRCRFMRVCSSGKLGRPRSSIATISPSTIAGSSPSRRRPRVTSGTFA
jgi:hypothetical protein